MALVIFLGVSQVVQAQQTYTLGAVHPFTGRFAFAGVHGQDAMKDAVDMANEAGGSTGRNCSISGKTGNTRTMWGSPPLKAFTPSTNPKSCGVRAPV